MIADPLGFVTRSLQRRGALVEVNGDGDYEAILPPVLAKELDLEEATTLVAGADRSRPGTEPCGLGTPVLEHCIQAVAHTFPVACVDAGAAEPRMGQARAQAERFGVRNGVHRFLEVTRTEGQYLRVWVAWIAAADDRFEGRVAFTLDVEGGGEPDAAFEAGIEALALADAGRQPGTITPRLAARIARRTTDVTVPLVQPLREATARRHARDHRRIVEYFHALAEEVHSARRRLDAQAVAAKEAHLHAEREAKLVDLGERMTLRVSHRFIAACWIHVPRATARILVKRRKSERELFLHLPPGAAVFDCLSCDACGGAVQVPALCDDHLHLLCERCLPNASGRPACGACR